MLASYFTQEIKCCQGRCNQANYKKPVSRINHNAQAAEKANQDQG